MFWTDVRCVLWLSLISAVVTFLAQLLATWQVQQFSLIEPSTCSETSLLLLSQVRINLGAGETELSSPKGLRLDDLSWHDVVISRREAAFTLQIDVIHVVK